MSEGFDSLYALQRTPRRRWLAAFVAAVVGLLLATLHWSGLFVGGGLVGWTMPTIRRGLLAGLTFGVMALLALVVSLSAAGSLGPATGLGVVTYVTVAIPLVLATLGGLSRGLVPDAPDRHRN